MIGFESVVSLSPGLKDLSIFKGSSAHMKLANVRLASLILDMTSNDEKNISLLHDGIGGSRNIPAHTGRLSQGKYIS